MSDDEQQDDVDAVEVIDAEESAVLIEDAYKRKNAAATVASLINDTFGDTVLDASRYTDAWWAEREQELAKLERERVERDERERMRARAEMLIHSEGQGARCRFPRWAVESALRATIETPAMKNSRAFLYAAERARLAADQRRLGERDDDQDASEPPRILLLGGGTGGGKTTATAWLALKSRDLMPGFIRASELERRGRYDKDLRGWIPERTSLVIDDLGAEVLDGKGVFRSFLDELVDDFYGSKRRLIFTTNLQPKIDDRYRAACAAEGREPEPQISERYGDRVRSRIIQIGHWAECGNTDLRTGAKP